VTAHSKDPISSEDPLDQIGQIVSDHASILREITERATQLEVHQRAFVEEFTKKCEADIIPAMEAILTRLRAGGGGGAVEYEPRGGISSRYPRITIWLSLEGEVRGNPSQDRVPYLQLDANPRPMKVEISEGDIWQSGPTWKDPGKHRAGFVGVWDLEELTQTAIIEEVRGILERAVKD
jgi:hypothetical protein